MTDKRRSSFAFEMGRSLVKRADDPSLISKVTSQALDTGKIVGGDLLELIGGIGSRAGKALGVGSTAGSYGALGAVGGGLGGAGIGALINYLRGKSKLKGMAVGGAIGAGVGGLGLGGASMHEGAEHMLRRSKLPNLLDDLVRRSREAHRSA